MAGREKCFLLSTSSFTNFVRGGGFILTLKETGYNLARLDVLVIPCLPHCHSPLHPPHSPPCTHFHPALRHVRLCDLWIVLPGFCLALANERRSEGGEAGTWVFVLPCCVGAVALTLAAPFLSAAHLSIPPPRFSFLLGFTTATPGPSPSFFRPRVVRLPVLLVSGCLSILSPAFTF